MEMCGKVDWGNELMTLNFGSSLLLIALYLLM